MEPRTCDVCSGKNIESNRISSKNKWTPNLKLSCHLCGAQRWLREPGTLSSSRRFLLHGQDTARSPVDCRRQVQMVVLPGSLVMADQVRYMVNRVTREDCRRPDLGWDSYTHTHSSSDQHQIPCVCTYVRSAEPGDGPAALSMDGRVVLPPLFSFLSLVLHLFPLSVFASFAVLLLTGLFFPLNIMS